jgi:hypothetical protein
MTDIARRQNDSFPLRLYGTGGVSTRVKNLQATDWGGFLWTAWLPLTNVTRTHLPPTAGLYRFRCRDEAGLLYVGEGANRQRRLGALIRARAKGLPPSYYRGYEPGHRPHRGHYAMPCIVEHERRGCTVELSWTTEVVEDLVKRRA